jgi:transcriptional regulator with PAS, ATPase and Fis domain
VLQERTFEPLGATRSETADARIIVATNKDLAEQVRRAAFREDLYYRVNVIRVELPPLRRRKEDIPLLVQQFIDRFNRLQQKSIKGIAGEALSLLMAHDWPGNVRELENIIERSFILCNEEIIDIEHLPGELTARNALGHGLSTIHTTRDFLEAEAIRTALERHSCNRLAAAKDLGMHKSTLFRKMKRLGIPLPQRDGRSQKT